MKSYPLPFVIALLVVAATVAVMTAPSVEAGAGYYNFQPYRPRISCGFLVCPNTGRAFPTCTPDGYRIFYRGAICQM